MSVTERQTDGRTDRLLTANATIHYVVRLNPLVCPVPTSVLQQRLKRCWVNPGGRKVWFKTRKMDHWPYVIISFLSTATGNSCFENSPPPRPVKKTFPFSKILHSTSRTQTQIRNIIGRIHDDMVSFLNCIGMLH